MSELFDGSVTPSLRHPGMLIACCCVVKRVNRLLGQQCPACSREQHPMCTDPGYVEAAEPPHVEPPGIIITSSLDEL